MPRKIRQLVRDLKRAGFSDVGGKGSHWNFSHPKVIGRITISGNLSDDADYYQETLVRTAIKESKRCKPGDRYLKIVRWSEEDGKFLGLCPELIYGGCHGSDPQEVFAELCEIVDEVVASMQDEGDALPPPVDYAALDDHIKKVRNSMLAEQQAAVAAA